MDKEIVKQFRSYNEMDTIYQDLHKKGLVNEPYIVRKRKDIQLMLFFGAKHSNDINDPQNVAIEKEWDKFISNKNDKKVAFCEGGLRPQEKSRNISIVKYAEPGLLTWLAAKDRIPIISPEPDETEEIKYLYGQGLNNQEIMTYYFGRQMYQWLKRDHVNYPDWRGYADRTLKSYVKLKPFQNSNMTLDSVLKMFRETTGKDFNKNDEVLLYKISDPTSNPVSAASGVFRDISLYQSIKAAWQKGQDIFSLYGSGHAIILENALKRL